MYGEGEDDEDDVISDIGELEPETQGRIYAVLQGPPMDEEAAVEVWAEAAIEAGRKRPWDQRRAKQENKKARGFYKPTEGNRTSFSKK